MVRKSKGDLGIVSASRTQTLILGGHGEGNFDKEIRGKHLTGTLLNYQVARACNIVESTLYDFEAESVDFTHCDFKDNAIRSSRFRDSKFGLSTWAYNTVVNTTFEACSFPDTDIQNCEFDSTSFVHCDLRNLLVKGCTFSRCSFRECQTSNKLFETCRLTECSFQDTELQAHTVAENFGLKITDLSGALRDDRLDRAHNKLSQDGLKTWIRNNAVHPLQELNIEYFLNGNLLDGSPCLDTCLNIGSWLPTFRTAASFAIVLNQWVEFLLWLYEMNQLAVHTLIRAHSMTDALLEAMGEVPRQQALTTISGTHLLLVRSVEQYLFLLEQCVLRWPMGVSLLVEGHQTKAYYYRALAPLFARGPARITKLVKHNSPWDLGITFASGSSAALFMGLFLATRTRIELFRIGHKVRDQSSEGTDSSTPVKKRMRKKGSSAFSTDRSIVSLDFGGSHTLKANPNFRLKAFLPGDLVAEFRLDVSSKQIGKLRKTLRDLLQ